MRWGLATLFYLLGSSTYSFATEPMTVIGNEVAASATDAAKKAEKNSLSDSNPKEGFDRWKHSDADHNRNHKDRSEREDEKNVVIRRDSNQESKKEEDERQRIREWNQQQDKKAYEYRMGQMAGFLGSHGAAAPLYKPSAGDAPPIAPYVAGEFKDAQGNLWKIIEGSPNRLADFSEGDTGETSSAPQSEDVTPSRDLDSVPVTEDAAPMEETTKSQPERMLLSISAPGGSAAASTYIGPQSNSFNIFLSAPAAPAAAPAIVRSLSSDSGELAPLETPIEKAEEKENQKAPTEGPALTIYNNISVEGASLEAATPTGSGTGTRLLLQQKSQASTKGKTGEVALLREGKHDARLSLEASYGSRGLASLEGRASRFHFWFLCLILLGSGLALAGRELHRNRMWGQLLAKVRRTPAAAPITVQKKTPSEATFATSATRIYRR